MTKIARQDSTKHVPDSVSTDGQTVIEVAKARKPICPRNPAHRNTRAYAHNKDAKVRYCVCDDCGEGADRNWKEPYEPYSSESSQSS